MTTPQDRTAAARKARHLNALRRKAPAMVEALRELGYTVIHPDDGAEVVAEILRLDSERKANLAAPTIPSHVARPAPSDPQYCMTCGGHPSEPYHLDVNGLPPVRVES